MNIKLERVDHKTLKDGESIGVDIYWPIEVKVKTTAYSFDKFALIVELGSALGLWLGLSALSFLDIALVCCRNRSVLCRQFKSKCNKCKQHVAIQFSSN